MSDLRLSSRVPHDAVRGRFGNDRPTNPGAKVEMNVDKYVDEKLLDELEREGLFQRISGKG
jgi:hypothetical protein